MNIYRCMRCGNNLEAVTDNGLVCPACGEISGFVHVTETNKDSIPFPSNPYDYYDFDPNACNDKEGICPCGVFTAHLINKQCDLISTAVPKEPKYSNCQCKAEVSRCGHSISHKLIDPCTGQK